MALYYSIFLLYSNCGTVKEFNQLPASTNGNNIIKLGTYKIHTIFKGRLRCPSNVFTKAEIENNNFIHWCCA